MEWFELASQVEATQSAALTYGDPELASLLSNYLAGRREEMFGGDSDALRKHADDFRDIAHTLAQSFENAAVFYDEVASAGFEDDWDEWAAQ